MLTYPAISPVLLHIGPLAVHWYGIMYLIGFAGGWALLTYRAKQPNSGFTPEQVSDLLFYAALGVILGGRIGYMLFYAWSDVVARPLSVFEIWKGGMSFHGGLIGVIVVVWIFARKIGKSLAEVTDFLAPAIPIGLGAGRIGNFINSELWGRPTDVPWAMIFPNGGMVPRHPSQLYEFFLEGVVLFLILWIYSMKPRPRYAVSGVFLAFYGIFRFIAEFFREPDPQRGYLAFGWLTEGQLLSFPMIIMGIGLVIWAYRRKTQCVSI